MMAWDNEERFRAQAVLEMLDQASSDFEGLMAARDRLDLFEKLGAMKLPELRRILLARVLLE
ncbi:MAG TPA: hypothetical protein VIZ59_07035 [Rubrobacteraceae bacterium]